MPPRFAGMGSHHSVKPKTEEWLTPPAVIAALGGADSFALDPCAPARQPWPTARQAFTKAQDGLLLPWEGRVWCNPPYSNPALAGFLGRMGSHGNGTALIFARTETDAFFRFVWDSATAVLFVRGRLFFHYPDPEDFRRCEAEPCEFVIKDAVTKSQGCRWCGRAKKNGGAPSVLCAYGQDDADILAACGIAGQFIPLRIPASWLIEAAGPSWRAVLERWFSDREGPARLEEIYRALASHPKARRNRNYQAKIRQQLQRGGFTRCGRGLWERKRA